MREELAENGSVSSKQVVNGKRGAEVGELMMKLKGDVSVSVTSL